MDDEQHAIVEKLLQPVGVAGLSGCGQVPAQLESQGRAEIVERLQEALDVGTERLRFDILRATGTAVPLASVCAWRAGSCGCDVHAGVPAVAAAATTSQIPPSGR